VEQPSAELQRARTLVLRHGWNATAYQIINPGIRHWFSPESDAVVGFVEHGGFRIVAGAPVCALERLTAVREQFESDAAQAGKRICYFGAESRLETCLRHSPDHAQVLLGAQPSFHPGEWPAMLASHASLRGQLHRARNKGVVVHEYPVERASSDLRIRGCLLEWLANRGLPPLHFLIEPETLERLYDRRVFVAERNGEPVGFLVASPVPQRQGWLVEQIIRGLLAPNGTAELMISSATQTFAGEGSAYVTLGLSPLSRNVAEELRSNPPWLRWLLAWLRAHGRRFYNFEGLDAFKRKFRPRTWEPVFAICNLPRFSPRVLYAIAAAFTDGRPARMGFRALAHAMARELNGREISRA
jgi:phosphatidylglycerol lysyltransferase